MNIRNIFKQFMKKRTWHNKIAKSKPNYQTLYEHSLSVFDIIEQIISLLDKIKPFKKREKGILRISAVLHDSGKEKDEWQKAIISNEKLPSHLDENLIKELLNELPEKVKSIDANSILSCINLHHKAVQTSGNILKEKLLGHQVTKWKELQEILDFADNLASCGSLQDAISLLENPLRFPLSKQLSFTYHQIYLRGISSIFLHKACQNVYESNGWKPVIFYPDGTIYLKSGIKNKIDLVEIIDSLTKLFNDGNYFGDKISHLLIGNPTTKIFPKPELFDIDSISLYFEKTYSLVSLESFKKKDIENKNGLNGRRSIINNLLNKKASDSEIE